MKITKQQLRRVIQEELTQILKEEVSMPSSTESPYIRIPRDETYVYKLNQDGTYTAFDTTQGNKAVYTGTGNIDRVIGGTPLAPRQTFALGLPTPTVGRGMPAPTPAAPGRSPAELGPQVGSDPQYGGGGLNVYGSGAPSQYDSPLGPTDPAAAYGELGDIITGAGAPQSAKDFRSAARGQARLGRQQANLGVDYARGLDRMATGRGSQGFDEWSKNLQGRIRDPNLRSVLPDITRSFADLPGDDRADVAGAVTSAAKGQRKKARSTARDTRKAGREGFRALKNIEREYGSPEEMRAQDPEAWEG